MCREPLCRMPDSLSNNISDIATESQFDVLRLEPFVSEDAEPSLAEFLETEILTSFEPLARSGYPADTLNRQEEKVVVRRDVHHRVQGPLVVENQIWVGIEIRCRGRMCALVDEMAALAFRYSAGQQVDCGGVGSVIDVSDKRRSKEIFRRIDGI